MPVQLLDNESQVLTLWIKQYLKFQEGTGEELNHIFYSKQFKNFFNWKIKQW